MSGLWLILIMESLGRRGQRNKKASAGTLLFLMCMFIATFPSLQEPQNKTCPVGDFLTEDGICCQKCSRGFKFVEKCRAEGQRTHCIPCPEGQYTDQMNYSPNCRLCRTCKTSKYEIEISPCRKDQNTICACKKGYYKSKIDSVTYECRTCKKCRPDEVEREICTQDSNTVCGCKGNYYKVNNKCEPCKNCSPECSLFCSVSTTATKPPENPPINMIAVAVAVVPVLLILVGFITYIFTKWHTQKRLLPSSQQSDVSPDSCKQVLVSSEEHLENNVKVVHQSPVVEVEVSNLPDCVPLEIKISDLIYTVLDVVPVLQVKQLVRSLGVTDTDIEQAEMDHRSCREAHYQMLRVWGERGSCSSGGGRGGMLHRPLLEELIQKLRMMHLGRAAEELETKYDIQ